MHAKLDAASAQYGPEYRTLRVDVWGAYRCKTCCTACGARRRAGAHWRGTQRCGRCAVCVSVNMLIVLPAFVSSEVCKPRVGSGASWAAKNATVRLVYAVQVALQRKVPLPRHLRRCGLDSSPIRHARLARTASVPPLPSEGFSGVRHSCVELILCLCLCAPYPAVSHYWSAGAGLGQHVCGLTALSYMACNNDLLPAAEVPTLNINTFQVPDLTMGLSIGLESF